MINIKRQTAGGSLICLLGKILFPQQPDWLRRQQVKIMLAVVLTSATASSIVVALILYAAGSK
jgi:hypothetical protein